MADTTTTITQAEPEYPIEQRVQKHFPAWHQLALVGITLISVFMNFFQLGKNGFGSYYPPAVRSMMDNWHNFFFASYDPGGFVTIDKPPVGFWFEVASAKLFGFSPFSVLVPQALAGVLSVLLLYYLVQRHFGVVAGLLAALALALSPISIVTNRIITSDSTLALTLLVGAWAVLRAAETGWLRWLLLSAVIVGIGFNIKMLEAYLVVPAFGLLYLLAAPRSIWKRIGHLALAGALLLVIWLLPLALLGMIALAWQRRPRLQSDRQQQSLVFWGMWLLTMGIFFSVAGFFHQYYMTEMAPAIAALFGIGLVTMWQDYRRPGWRGWLLPLALIATVAEQVYILTSYPAWGQWMIPLMVVLCVLAVGVLLSARVAPRLRLKAPSTRFLVPALGAGVLALMLAPTVWAGIPILTRTRADTLVAGPSQRNGIGGNFAGGRYGNASG